MGHTEEDYLALIAELAEGLSDFVESARINSKRAYVDWHGDAWEIEEWERFIKIAREMVDKTEREEVLDPLSLIDSIHQRMEGVSEEEIRKALEE